MRVAAQDILLAGKFLDRGERPRPDRVWIGKRIGVPDLRPDMLGDDLDIADDERQRGGIHRLEVNGHLIRADLLDALQEATGPQALLVGYRILLAIVIGE